MGSIMNAKYKGTCQYCDSEWKVGDKIYYQKTPKAICSEERCFNEQGGKVSEWKPQDKKTGSFNTQPDTNLKMDIPDVPVSDGFALPGILTICPGKKNVGSVPESPTSILSEPIIQSM